MMLRLDDIFEFILLDSYKTNQNQQVVHVSPVPEDKEYTHKQIAELTGTVITVNEARERIGLEPLKGEQFDTVNGTTIAQPIETKSVRVTLKPDKQVTKMNKADQVKKISEDAEKYRSQLEQNSDIYAVKVKRAISKFLNTQEFNIIDKIDVKSKMFDDWLYNINEETEAMTLLVTPIILELMDVQIQDTTHFITGELIAIPLDVQRDVEVQIRKIAGIFNTDTIVELQNSLKEGQMAGESLNSLKKRVESVYADAKGYRAERIARTESIRSANRASEIAYKANGYNEVEWFINPGACEFCKTFSGKTKTIGSEFVGIGDVINTAEGSTMSITYDDISVPPLHPNCACSIIPVGE
jgi:hypothetical protein